MKKWFDLISKTIITPFILSLILIILFSGCIQRPILLRNRPNVPPPMLDPNKGVTLLAAGDAEIIESDTPPIIPTSEIKVPETLPPPDIKTAPVTYTVVKGDSFWRIGRIYGVSKEELAACNNLSLDKPLKIGTVLLIPPGGEFIPESKRPPIKKSIPKKTVTKTPKKKVEYIPSGNDGTYTVKQGDSLWKIARRYNVKTSLLASANKLDIRKPLQISQKLVIPGKGAETEPVTNTDIESVPENKTPESSTDIIDDTSPADDLLNDAEKAATGNSTMNDDANNKGKAVDVINELDEAVKVAEETEIPGSLYTEEVLPNETLQDIADRHGFTPEQIRAVNPKLPADGKLKPFTSIKIPNK